MRNWIFAALLLAAVPTAAVDSATQGNGLRSFVRGSWQELRQEHEGQPIVVHFWGLTCGPCLAELPDWASAVKERRDLHLVLIDANPFGDDPQSVRKVLAEDGLAKLENWTFADTFQERLRFEVDPHWQGEMPYTLLIGRNGSVTAVTGLMNFAALDKWLDKEAKSGS